MDKILVFIPMYNCEAQIGRVLTQFDPSFADLISQVLVVDNRSTDESVEVCKAALKRLRGFQGVLVQNCENYGLGGSHKVAFEYARKAGFDYVVVLHGDDQADVRDVIPYLRQGAHREVDALLGSRFMRGASRQGYVWYRTWGNRLFNLLFSAVAGRNLLDLGSGLNVYQTRSLGHGDYLGYPNALTFNYYMILGAVARNQRFRFFPHTWREEDQASNVRLMRQGLTMFKILYQFARSRESFLQNWHVPPRCYATRVLQGCPWPCPGDATFALEAA